MGSLMSGWDSPVGDSDSVRRCKSLTRGEIDAFWKTNKKDDAEHVQAVAKLVAQEVAESQAQEEKKVEEDRIENQSKWWRKSNWAFLNEPREEEGRPNNYVPQFQVAHIAKIAG
uniref:Uncharacterized protein n=1 Tax=Noccaea caerulescens TaxID=107243 RepID=A0A1J3CAT9_NOCCA